MSAHGCGHPVTLGSGEVVTCGTRLTTAPSLPIACPACQGQAALAAIGLPVTAEAWQAYRASAENALRTLQDGAGAICEGCGLVPATRTWPPRLCAACEAEYAADLAAEDTKPEHPGSRCSEACGHCGRCGGA